MKHLPLYAYFLIFTAMTLPSCSMQKTAASYGDYFIKRNFKSYVDLNDAQEEKVDKLVDQFWAELKSGKIDAIAQSTLPKLEPISTQLEKQAYEDINSHFKQIVLDLLDRYSDQISEVLLSLNEKQIKQLQTSFEEKNEERKEHLKLPNNERLEKSEERMLDNFERWYGEPSEKQVLALKQFTQSRPDVLDQLNSRLSVQKNLIDLLKAKPNATELVETLKQWTLNPALMRDPAYREEYSQVREYYKGRTIYFNELATSAQKQYAKKKITDFINDIREGIKDS